MCVAIKQTNERVFYMKSKLLLTVTLLMTSAPILSSPKLGEPAEPISQDNNFPSEEPLPLDLSKEQLFKFFLIMDQGGQGLLNEHWDEKKITFGVYVDQDLATEKHLFESKNGNEFTTCRYYMGRPEFKNNVGMRSTPMCFCTSLYDLNNLEHKAIVKEIFEQYQLKKRKASNPNKIEQ
jgi:hypothetical protein